MSPIPGINGFNPNAYTSAPPPPTNTIGYNNGFNPTSNPIGNFQGGGFQGNGFQDPNLAGYGYASPNTATTFGNPAFNNPGVSVPGMTPSGFNPAGYNAMPTGNPSISPMMGSPTPFGAPFAGMQGPLDHDCGIGCKH